MNPLAIPGFIIRGLICAATEHLETLRELAEARRKLRNT